MNKISNIPEVEKASSIPTLTDVNERELLSQLAKEVPPTSIILEIGCLYGGVTAVLALSNPNAVVYCIDNFSWHPEGFPPTGKKVLLENMQFVGVHNVSVIEGTSQQAGRLWQTNISLLWIDGGHDFKTVYHDLVTFGHYANVIALHDYDNPAWKDIRQAVETFLSKPENSNWYLDQVVGMVAVLRKK
jgi:precorrin-6B methylase 2